MPQNTTIAVGPSWQMLTDANVTEATLQNIGSGPIYVTGTNGTGAPPVDSLGVIYRPGEGEASRPLAEMFPGVSGVNRLWAKSPFFATQVFISHA